MLQRLSKWLILALVIAVVIIVGGKKSDSVQIKPDSITGQSSLKLMDKRFTFNLQNQDKQLIKSSEIYRDITVLLFLSTWCPNAETTLDMVNKYWQKVGQEKSILIVMSIDEEIGQIKQYLDARAVKLPIMLVPASLLNQYPDFIKGVPTTVIVDKMGKIISKHEGNQDEEVLAQTVDKYL